MLSNIDADAKSPFMSHLTYIKSRSQTLFIVLRANISSPNTTNKMGCTASVPLGRPGVPTGMIRLCVSGFGISHHTGRAKEIVDTIVQTYPDEYESWYYFDTFGFRPQFLTSIKSELTLEQQNEFKDHNTSPFCWVETPNSRQPFAIGGRDKLCEWVFKHFADNEQNAKILKLCREMPSRRKDAFFNSNQPGTASIFPH